MHKVFRSHWFYFALIIAISFVFRLYQIDIRPLHNDEAVNHLFLGDISRLGYYPYSHLNYHGPFYFYITFFLVSIFGDSELGLRLSSILMGVGLASLPLMLRGQLGWKFVYVSSVLLSISTSLFFFSRYAIHETSFVFLAVLLFFSLHLWLEHKNKKYFYIAVVSLAFFIATKETFIITIAVLGFCILVSYYNRIKEFFPGRVDVYWCIGILVFILIILFSGFFLNIYGIKEMFLAVPQWVGRNSSDTGHFKPWGYYFSIIFSSLPLDYLEEFGLKKTYWKAVKYPVEPQFIISLVLLVFTFKPLIKFNANSINRFGFISFLSTLLITGIYSFPVDYKAPWLIMSICAFWSLFLAWQIYYIIESKKFKCVAIVLLLTLVSTLASNIYYNFSFPYGANNPLSYVHTSKGALDLKSDIESYCDKNDKAKVLIAVNSYWPLPYYLRNSSCKIAYKQAKTYDSKKRDHDVVVLDKGIKTDDPAWATKYYRISDVQETMTWYRRR